MKEVTKRILRYVVAIVLIVVSVWLAFRDVNLEKLWRIIINANYLYVLLPVPVIIMSHWVRARRWKTMLEPALEKKSPSTWNLFSAVMIGYAVNCVLPRGGEFVRPFVYSRREKVSYSTTFATIIVERFIDLLTLLLLFAFALLIFGNVVVRILPEAKIGSVAMIVALLLFVLLISFYPPFFRFFIRVFVNPFSSKIYNRLNEIYDKFLQGFAVIKNKSQYFRLTLESLTIWFFYTVPLYIMFFAFDFQYTLDLGFDAAIFLIIVSGVGVTIAPTPGAVGVYHLLISGALVNLYGVDHEEALAYATIAHFINYLVQITIGGAFFFRENIKRIPREAEMASTMRNGQNKK